VYLGISGNGVGKVTVTVNGKVSTMDARSSDGKDIPTSARIVVKSINNAELIVEEVKLVNLNTSAK